MKPYKSLFSEAGDTYEAIRAEQERRASDLRKQRIDRTNARLAAVGARVAQQVSAHKIRSNVTPRASELVDKYRNDLRGIKVFRHSNLDMDSQEGRDFFKRYIKELLDTNKEKYTDEDLEALFRYFVY